MSFLIRDIILKRIKIKVIPLDNSAGDALEIPVSIKKKSPAGASPGFFKKFWLLAFILFIAASQVAVFSAFEAHIINVTAHICNPLEVRSMGYWMTHPNVYVPYLPQDLGDEEIDTVEKAQEVFNSRPFPPPTSIQRTMLKKHLLAMKFNIAYFGIGEYLVESEGKNLNQIVAEADDLLRDPNSTKDELEEIKDILDYLNGMEQPEFCFTPLSNIVVIIPNGGEEWQVGNDYDISWTSDNLNCPNGLSYASIWYSADNGSNWINIISNADNNGSYNWQAPLLIDGHYAPSDMARIKIVVRCSDNDLIVGWDMSDNNFRLSVDYDLLTEEDWELLREIASDESLEAEESEEPDISDDTEVKDEEEKDEQEIPEEPEVDEEESEEGTEEETGKENEDEELPAEDEEHNEGKEEEPTDEKMNNEEGEPDPESDPIE